LSFPYQTLGIRDMINNDYETRAMKVVAPCANCFRLVQLSLNYSAIFVYCSRVRKKY